MPQLTDWLGQPLVLGHELQRPGCLLKPIDACLGVPGLPQSATGQTALYTGCNAPRFRGQHQTGFANGSLRPLIASFGVLRRTVALSLPATLANLYSPQYFHALATRRLRYSVGTLLNLTANLPFRMQWEYEQGRALFWDITGERAHHRGIAAAPLAPAEAGQRLATLGADYALTLFESYLTDFAGHSQNLPEALQVLSRVDEFLMGLIENLDPLTTLIISSDHGNLENLATKRHTLNPVPLLVIGPDAAAFSAVEAITGITPAILNLLQIRQTDADKAG